MKRSVALSLLVLALLAPAIAAADAPADRQLLAEVSLAVTFWAAHDAHGCPGGVSARIVDGLTENGQYAWGTGGSCAIAIHAGLADYSRRPGPRVVRRGAREIECGVVVHEVGHALGLAHADSGVMAELDDGMEIPWECEQWASPRARTRWLHVVERATLRSYVRR